MNIDEKLEELDFIVRAKNNGAGEAAERATELLEDFYSELETPKVVEARLEQCRARCIPGREDHRCFSFALHHLARIRRHQDEQRSKNGS